MEAQVDPCPLLSVLVQVAEVGLEQQTMDSVARTHAIAQF
jgi:hypothetical protein